MDDDRINKEVGKRLKFLRTIRGLSQEELGEVIGVTFQQIQKYEKGLNSIKASKLYAIAQHLNVPVEQFFAAMDEAMSAQDNTYGDMHDTPSEAIKLMRHYQQIQDPILKNKLLSLIRAMAEEKLMVE
jgi:transcriptional regulator with XRE-family HTH domain